LSHLLHLYFVHLINVLVIICQQLIVLFGHLSTLQFTSFQSHAKFITSETLILPAVGIFKYFLKLFYDLHCTHNKVLKVSTSIDR
jgi:hypothetical protein